MRVPLSWLRDYVDWPWEPGELAERLTMAGVNVEAVEELGAGVRGIVVARVEKVEPHPRGGGLWVVEVDAGSGRTRRVVAGVANMRPGDTVPYAPPGSTLPGGWEIGVRRVRGVESEGMLLALSELVLGEKPREGEGILVLGREAVPGSDAAELLGLPERVLELDLTPNYATFCQSLIGVAREVAALTRAGPAGVKRPDPYGALSPSGPEAAELARVTIRDPDLCRRYVARVISGVRLGPSPWWLQLRVLAAGMRPINNIVDATNYVMLEYGQPLHAFDMARLRGRHVVVRRASEGEVIVTLDGVRRTLEADMLVIADEERPVAVAGVMGGEDSEVGPGTTDILLESAHFDPKSVRRTSTRLGLTSEASSRFEKGADPEAVDPASARAAALIAELAGGTVAPGSVDVYPRPLEPVEVELRPHRVSALLGVDITPDETASLLHLLGFRCRPLPARGKDVLSVTVPSWRADVSAEADLIEEVARLYGYGRIPPTLPRGVTTVGRRSPTRRLADRAKAAMVHLGFTETVSFSLVDPETVGLLSPVDVKPLTLANPLSANQSVMRTGLLGGLVEAVERNLSRAERVLRLFELGAVYWPRGGPDGGEEDLPEERPFLAAVAVGRTPEGVGPLAGWEPDFFYMKGVLSAVLWELGVAGWDLERTEDRRLHPGRSAAVVVEGQDGEAVELGVIGELDPRVLKAYDVEERVTALELDVVRLLEASRAAVRFRSLPRHPAVSRDVAVVLPEEVEAGRIEEVIRRSAGALCAGVRLFDVYRGDPVPPGHRSTAWRVVYRAPDRSLTDAEVDEVHGRVREALREELGASLR
ncbi:MAG TPA: phenylalanine--tRNA ligase subunit beta [Clostridiales bacterium]|nr:phenylalanine--tRNA ligase subunit beta [Clostridiales bacterium]